MKRGKYAKEPINRIQEWIWLNYIRKSITVSVTNKASRAIQNVGGKSITIPHSVDANIYKPLNLSKEPFALFVGRLVEEKGIYQLIQISKLLKKSGIYIKIIGKGPLESIIKKSPNIQYEGYVSKYKLVELYNQASVLVLPSIPVKGWTELFGITIIEALACGTPVIASNLVGPK
jgi:glycosyltransferase involved in cell wall biosynthesis